MIDRGHSHRLAAQTLARERVSRQLAWQQLDGDLTIEPRVPGAIDLAHTSGPEGGHNLVAAESRAGRKRQAWQTGRILARMRGSNRIAVSGGLRGQFHPKGGSQALDGLNVDVAAHRQDAILDDR
jgi:hypothetical protein